MKNTVDAMGGGSRLEGGYQQRIPRLHLQAVHVALLMVQEIELMLLCYAPLPLWVIVQLFRVCLECCRGPVLCLRLGLVGWWVLGGVYYRWGRSRRVAQDGLPQRLRKCAGCYV